jgi:drug/metabolite transporter (DMT)-like permease
VNQSNVKKTPLLLVALAFFAVYVIWGSTYLAIRIGVASIEPLLLAGVRFCLAGCVLYAGLRLFKVPPPTPRQWLHASVGGAFMITMGNGLVTIAEEHTPSNLAALLIACVPLHIAVLDWLRPGGTRPAARALVGVVLGLVGMILLVAPDGPSDGRGDAFGVGAVLVAGLAWAVGTLYARYTPRHAHAAMGAAQQMIAGGALLLLLSLLHGDVGPAALERVTFDGVVALVYLTVCGSLVAFSAYSWLVGVTTPSRISTVAFVNPVIAVLLGWLLLDETLSARALWGALLIVGAVAAMSLKVPLLWRNKAESSA